jgi:hypothetical protein
VSRIAALIAAAACTASCAGPALKPALAPAAPHRDALLILPGLGYGRGDSQAFRSVARSAAGEGIDVYVSDYLTRDGLATSRDKLRNYVRAQRLDRYERLHVFAFIAGAWAFNPMVERDSIPNLATVVYDRSPLQELAPSIAAQKMPVLAWLRYGSTIFDLARTPYPQLAASGVKVAVLVETRPTKFMRKHDREARELGPVVMHCDAIDQRYDACWHVPMSHDELYTRFDEIWPDVRAFIRTGKPDRP